MRRLWAATAAVRAVPALLPAVATAHPTTTTAPTLTGTAQVGDQLTCGQIPASSWTDATPGGGAITTFEYSFYTGSVAPANLISSAFPDPTTGNGFYTVQPSDKGNTIVCTQTDSDTNGGGTESPGSTATAAVIQPGPTQVTPPTLTGAPQDSNTLTCTDGTWSVAANTPPGDSTFVSSVQWFLGASTTPIAGQSSDELTLTAKNLGVATDVGQTVSCKVIEEDEDTEGTTTSAQTAQTSPITPLPSVTVTEFGTAVSGNIGEAIAGVTVSAALNRPTGAPAGSPQSTTVANGTATTAADGSWSVTLSPTTGTAPDGFAPSNGDFLSLSYSGGPTGTTVPASFEYGSDSNGNGSEVPFKGSLSQVNSAGTVVGGPDLFDSTMKECAPLSFIIGGTPHASTPGTTFAGSGGGNDCEFTTAAATDSTVIQAQFTTQVTQTVTGLNPGNLVSGEASNLVTVQRVGLPGTGANGAPTISVDQVFGHVTVKNLNGDKFTLTDSGGTVPVTTTQVPGTGTNGTPALFTGKADIPLPVTGTVTLSGTTGAVSVDNVPTLVVSQTDGTITAGNGPFGINSGIAGGSCTPGKALSDGTGSLCPASGTMTNLEGGTTEFDDLSGNSNTVDIPVLNIWAPGGTMIGQWTAFADLYDPSNPGQEPNPASPGTLLPPTATSAILAATKSVSFQVVGHGGSPSAVGPTAMTISSDGVGPFATLTLPTTLAPGRYQLEEKLTDSHGDTSNYESTFVQQGGSTGPAGPTGPAGKNGTSAKCTVQTIKHTTGTGRHKKTTTTQKIVCVTVPTKAADAAVTTIALSRGHRTYAVGTASARGGSVKITLQAVRQVTHGSYTLTIVTTTGKKATVQRTSITI